MLARKEGYLLLRKEATVANQNWKRSSQLAELAPTYLFLASADSRYYTGELFALARSTTVTR